MSLQFLWSILHTYPSQALNGLALFFALCGSWLLAATRMREQRAIARLAGDGEIDSLDSEACLLDEPVQRINRFFYRFGYGTLTLAFLLSWGSTQF